MAKGRATECLLCAFALMLFLVAPGHSAVSKKLVSVQPSFRELDGELGLFQKDAEARKYRHRYEELINRFEMFAKKAPQSEHADDALMNAASLTEDVAQITKTVDDWKAAERAYLVIVDKYSDKSFADSALYKAARIRFGELKDREGAKNLLKRFLPKDKRLERDFKSSSDLLTSLTDIVKPTDDVHTIRRVDFEDLESQCRLVIGASGELVVKRGEIKKSDQNSKRVFFDLTPAKLNPGVPAEIDVNRRGVLKIRAGQYQMDTVRVVIEVDDDTKLSLLSHTNDVVLGISSGVARKIDSSPSLVVAAPEFIKKDLGLRPKKIVLDPGHGGDDPGAIGRKGLKEKQVTLAIAKRVKRLIERDMPDIKVYLTRDDDRTLPLSKRTEFANNLEADLFVSIHANAAQNQNAQGIETYYLNIAHDRYAIRLAARENAMSENEISNLEYILADLAMKSNVSDSIRLGQVVQSSTCSRLRQQGWPDAKDLGLKHALFYVLLGARMPAILIETSFISNREEEKRLKSEPYQHALAEGVVKGIRSYVEEKQALYAP